MPQQRRQGHLGRTPSPTRLVRRAAVAGGLALLPLAVGCDAAGEEAADERKASKKTAAVEVVAPADVEVIANLTGCKVTIRIDATELREGACHTETGDYLITTFPEERYKLTWLDSAAIYGGTYLVGPRWAISAQPKVLEPLRAKVGGTVQRLRGSDATTGP
ncbi:hypothetical protein ACFXKC_55080 [Streptomyces sp. NPDC059340]|uniref:hypothetical protein n=1 Tax=unclassified Streptomyces TaxID=2593676 RepID=UPI00367BA4D1